MIKARTTATAHDRQLKLTEVGAWLRNNEPPHVNCLGNSSGATPKRQIATVFKPRIERATKTAHDRAESQGPLTKSGQPDMRFRQNWPGGVRPVGPGEPHLGVSRRKHLRKYRWMTKRLEQLHVEHAKRQWEQKYLAARSVVRGPKSGDPTPEEIRQHCVAIRSKWALKRLKQISYGDAYRDETPHEDYWPSVSHRAVPASEFLGELSTRRGWYCMGAGKYRRALSNKIDEGE